MNSKETHIGLTLNTVQTFIAEWFFPISSKNWYEKSCAENPSFYGFFNKIKEFNYEAEAANLSDMLGSGQISQNSYEDELKILDSMKVNQDAFLGVDFHTEKNIPMILAHDRSAATVDLISVTPSDPTQHEHKPGYNKHIIKFQGANAYYEGGFKDLGLQATATGATIYTFNYPGVNRSTGSTREFNDLVNSGMAVVRNLLEQGINPDEIILDGNCFGSAVAFAVHQEFAKSGIKIRVITGNTFTNFTDAITAVVSAVPIVNMILTRDVLNDLLHATGWSYSISDYFDPNNPYMGYHQREGDGLLKSAVLKSYLDKYEHQHQDDESSGEWFYVFRNKLKQHSKIQIKESEIDKIKKKFGKFDPHFAFYYQCENVFDYLNFYLKESDDYLATNNKTFNLADHTLPEYLDSFANDLNRQCCNDAGIIKRTLVSAGIVVLEGVIYIKESILRALLFAIAFFKPGAPKNNSANQPDYTGKVEQMVRTAMFEKAGDHTTHAQTGFLSPAAAA